MNGVILNFSDFLIHHSKFIIELNYYHIKFNFKC